MGLLAGRARASQHAARSLCCTATNDASPHASSPALPPCPPSQAHGSAVDLRGSGRLSGVRAIYSTGHALVWLEVDSSNGLAAAAAAGTAGIGVPSDAAGLAGKAPAVVATPGGLPRTPAPSWLARPAAAGFDAAAFQRRAEQLAGGPPALQAQQQAQQRQQAGPQQQQEQLAGQGGIERKAEEWCRLHHSSLAPARPDAPQPARQG